MSLTKTYTTVGSATLASRLTGFVRDVMIAAVLGSSAVADAYIAAFLLPNLFRRVLSEGAFNAAFVPIYARRRAESGEESVRAFTEAALSSLVALVLIALLLAEFMMPLIIAGIAPGFAGQPQKFADAVAFGRIAFVFVGAIIVTALISSILNAVGRYALVALAPLILNFLLIGVLAVLLLIGWRQDYRTGMALVITVLIAGLAQLMFVSAGLRRAGVHLGWRWPGRDSDVHKLMLLILPGLMIAGAGHFNMVVAAQLSSAIPSAVSWLYYADRIFQLPLGFVAAAIGTVLLPEVARAIAANDPDTAEAAGNRALEFGMMLVLPAALALAVLADPIVDIIYRRGAFMLADSQGAAAILRALAFGLPGFVLVKVFLPPHLARESFRAPMMAALAGIGVNVVVTLALLGRLGPSAAAVGVAASAWVNAGILGVGLFVSGRFAIDALALKRLPRIILASLATASVAWGLQLLLAGWIAPDIGFGWRITGLGLICVAGLFTHLIVLFALDVADVQALRNAFGRQQTPGM